MYGFIILFSGFIVTLFFIGGSTTIYLSDANASQIYNIPKDPIAKDNNKDIFILDVFMDEGFAGNNTKINKNTPYLQGPFQDSISSVKIAPGQNFTEGYMVELCEHKSYAGECMILGAGNYDVESLTLLHDKIDSIRFLSPSTLQLKGLS